MHHFSVILSVIILGASCFKAQEWKRLSNRWAVPWRPSPEERRQVATWRLTANANRLFSHRLFSNIARQQTEGNIFLSPFIVSAGLSMTLLGAKGETADEIMAALSYADIGTKKNGKPYTKDDVPRLYKTIFNLLEKSSGEGQYLIRIANRLFADSSQTFYSDFLEDTENFYGARLKQVDFRNNPEEARQEINAWVRNKTDNTIQEAVSPGAVSSSTLIALVSTAVFKGLWQQKFNPALTYSGVFTTLDGRQIQTDFMNGEFRLQYHYFVEMQCHVLIIPYKTEAADYSVQMELFLPVEERLFALEGTSEDKFHRVLGKALMQTVDVHLPKFRIEYSVDLAEALQRLDIRTLFGDADLSGMNGAYNLNIGSISHKTFIQVDEEGTTAGASMVQTMNRSVREYIRLRFDHPFVVIIRETHTNTILFMGRIANPAQ